MNLVCADEEKTQKGERGKTAGRRDRYVKKSLPFLERSFFFSLHRDTMRIQNETGAPVVTQGMRPSVRPSVRFAPGRYGLSKGGTERERERHLKWARDEGS